MTDGLEGGDMDHYRPTVAEQARADQNVAAWDETLAAIQEDATAMLAGGMEPTVVLIDIASRLMYAVRVEYEDDNASREVALSSLAVRAMMLKALGR
jgi:hypothetical protein